MPRQMACHPGGSPRHAGGGTHTLGTVVANTTVNVTSRVQGVVDSAAFKEGQFVKKGDLLFQIDPRGFEAALAQAKAVLAKDQAQLTNANRDRDRYQSLAQQGAISDQQRATSATNADVLAATVAADKAAVDLAALNLDYTQIRSPVDGKTGPLLVQPGNMVSATNLAALVTIQQVRPVKGLSHPAAKRSGPDSGAAEEQRPGGGDRKSAQAPMASRSPRRYSSPAMR